MFGWRKRSEGFEWQEYVRTTILVRRANRQKRVDEARLAAIAKVKDARDRGIEAGHEQLSVVKAKAAEGAEQAKTRLVALIFAAARAAAAAGIALWTTARGFFKAIPISRLEVPVGVKGAASLAALYAGDMPRRWRKLKRNLLPLGAMGLAVFGFGALLSPGDRPAKDKHESKVTSVTVSGLSNAAAPSDRDGVLSGRASALSGDTLRLNKRIIRLAGIEAPAIGQACEKANGRRFDCGASAETALSHLVRRQRITCELSGEVRSGAEVANCRAGDTDIARELVRTGHVFANGLDGTPYSREEEISRTERTGIWEGPNERPEAWRAKVWDLAKRASPEGCPIKGLVRGAGRIYSMPWSAGYDGRKVREVRGERWFCSEDEAQAAGFRLAEGL